VCSADKNQDPEETDPTETTEDESEIIDLSEFERKISAMTSLDRDAALRLASDLVIRLHRRTCSERFREQSGDRTRVAYARVLVSALQTYGVLLRDDEIEQLKQKIEALERIKGETKP
jgi:ABC-type arginine transport system ATPase subunit